MMGLFDIFEELVDIGRDIVQLPGEIAKAAVECGNDITEVVAQNVTNTIKGESYKESRTSYDIREEAEKIVRESNNHYQDAKNHLSSAWKMMLRESKEVSEKRSEVYALIGAKVSSTTLKHLPPYSESSVQALTIPYLDSSQFDMGTNLGLLGTSMRMEAAEEYLESAKDFRVETKEKISEINQLKRCVLSVTNAHKEELEMLSIIRRTYMNQPEATLIQSADWLFQISELCLESVTSQTNQKYNTFLDKLKVLWY